MKESEYVPHSQEAIDRAKKENLLVVFPKPNELLIDIDNAEDLKTFKRCHNVLEEHFGIVGIETAGSMSGRADHLHITVTLETEVTDLQRVALQACLGSDRMREILGLVMALSGDPHPTLFLEKIYARCDQEDIEKEKVREPNHS